MRITILTYGSRGDVQPFIALAHGLQKAGHTVRLAAASRFAEFVEGHGISFAALAGDPEEISVRLNDSRKNIFGTVKSMTEYVYSIADAVFEDCLAACKDADLIVHSFFFTTGGHSLARALGIPDVSVQAFPMFAPTRVFPNVAMPRVPAGALSYFSHWISNQIFWHIGNLGFRRLHASRPGGIDLKLYWPFDPAGPMSTPLLFAHSPTVLPKPADWDAPHIHVTGYFFLDTPETYAPAPELARFLAAGDPPVCVTFGSMVNREADRIYGVVCEALKQTRQRAIILTGWGGSEQAKNDETLLFLKAAPHDWLLPRCKSVIHHGGAGTTAAGLRAGIPNIVVPHAADQPFWGMRVAAIGAGPKPLSLSRLSTESLVEAFAHVDAIPVRARAREIGQKIRAEDGVGWAVRLIERHAAEFTGVPETSPHAPALRTRAAPAGDEQG